MTHQKARDPEGHVCWVRLGPPTFDPASYFPASGTTRPTVSYETHCLGEDNQPIFVDAEGVELLAEFTENPEPQDFHEWLASEKRRLGLGGVPQ